MKKTLKTALTLTFWLAVWWIASLAVGMELLLPSPVETLLRLVELVATLDFWAAVGYSMTRIMLGFAAAFLVGAILAWVASRVQYLRELLSPIVSLMTATPVASFVILALVWVKSGGLATFCVFMMCLPIIYTNILVGLRGADAELLEMARAFRFSRRKTFTAVRLPALIPHLTSALRIGVGFAWKSGIAGEVIAIPRGTVGAGLYASKVVLDTSGVLAWTAIIVVLSVALEKLVLLVSMKIAAIRPSSKNLVGVVAPPHEQHFFFKGITFGYGGKTVLENYSADFPAGSVTALMGRSGSGKTTILKLVAGLLSPLVGKAEASEGASFVFQESRLLPQLNVFENVEIVGAIDAATILSELGLERELSSLPASLSGGMARRVALARALAFCNSAILLLDEPFSGLDDDMRKRAADCILRHRRGRTIVISTHDTAEADLLGADICYVGEK